MESKDIVTVGDLINFLLQYDTNKKVMVYEVEWGQNQPLQHIDIEDEYIVIY